MNKHHHNKGQEDASKGRYQPPGKGLVADLLFGSSRREISDSKSCNKGWREGERKKR